MHLIQHFDHAGAALGEVQPAGVSITGGLNTPESISYQMDLDSSLSVPQYTEPYATDWLLFYDENPLMGGLHTEVNIDDVDQGFISVAGKGWLHYFERRTWPAESVDMYAVIARDLFDIAEDLFTAVDGLGLTMNNTTSGQVIDYHIDVGDTETILSKIDALSKLEPGFDYEITWDKELKLYAPNRGSLSDYSLEQGRNCGPLAYRNPGIGGNALFGTGSSSQARASSFLEDSLSQAKYRRLDVNKDFGEISSPDLLDELTTAELPRQITPLNQVSITWLGDENIPEGQSIFNHVWLGDTVKVIGDTGYNQFDENLRVVGIEINPTEEEDDVVTFTFDDGTLSL